MEQKLLEAICNPAMKQADVAVLYNHAMFLGHLIDWRKVNLAIIERWSRSGLERIKRMAWGEIPLTNGGVHVHD